MCQYRYYYYGGCQHQETHLYSFCDRAIVPSTTVARSPDPPAPDVPPASHEGVVRSDAVVARGDGSAPDNVKPLPNSPTLSSSSSTQHTTTSSFSASSSVPTSFASISESALDTASIQKQRHSLRRHSEASSTTMTTFSPFGLKSWITGSAARPGPVTTTAGHEVCGELTLGLSKQARSLRARPDGIRENTDESCNLADSGDMLRHIAASCRGNFHPQHIGTESVQGSPFIDDLANGSMRDQLETASESYDAIESEIDMLKDEVIRLRGSGPYDGTAPRTEAEMKIDKMLSTRGFQSKIPAPVSHSQESAAAHLQKAHEQAQQKPLLASPEHKRNPAALPPPTSLDFPDLTFSVKATKTMRNGEDGRRPSYRDVSTTGILASSTLVTMGNVSQTETDIDSDSVIISHQNPQAGQASDTSAILKASPKSPVRRSPRFAQPTKSFARRTDETLRKDGTLTSPKVTPEGSPTKSIRTLSHRQQKRKSLPSGWMFDASGTSGNAASTREDKVTGLVEPKISPGQILQKKASSYMSPTEATTRRNLATLSEGTAKGVPPKVQKPLARIDTSIVSMSELNTPSSETIASSGTAPSCDSFKIITERPPTQSTDDAQILGKSNEETIEPVRHQPVVHTFPQNDSQKPSSRMFRRLTVGSSVADLLADKARAAGLPQVANTKPTRRGSHGHLLLPIANKLAKLGLLRADGVATSHSCRTSLSSPRTTETQAVRDGLSATPCNLITSKAVVSPEASVHRPKCVPPHCRRNQCSVSGDTAALPNSTLNVASTAAVAAVPPTPPIASCASQTPFLNAAAKEFKPRPKRQTLDEQLRSGNLEALTAFRTDEEWQGMSPQERRMVAALRDLGGTHNRTLSATMPALSPSTSAFKMANRQYWKDLNTQQPQAHGSLGPPERDVFNGLSGVQAGQMIKPEVDRQTNSIRWILQGTDGMKASLSFGRAAPPPCDSPESPNLSSGANMVTSQNSPGSWAIAPARSDTGRYGWSGGDGREVKFTGCGPDAERDPNTPVNFNFQSSNRGTGRGPRIAHGPSSNSPPLAPRSRKQWAERLGYSMVPCGEVDITHAMEYPVAMNPFTRQLSGYCFDHAWSATVG